MRTISISQTERPPDVNKRNANNVFHRLIQNDFNHHAPIQVRNEKGHKIPHLLS